MKKALFIAVFVFITAFVYGRGEWVPVRGDDGRMWWIHYVTREDAGGIEATRAIFRQQGMQEIRPANAHNAHRRELNIIASQYVTRRGNVITGTIARPRTDVAAFGSTLYGFIMHFTSETRYNLYFFVRR